MIAADLRSEADLLYEIEWWQSVLERLEKTQPPEPFLLRKRPKVYMTDRWKKGCRDQNYDYAILWATYKCCHTDGHLFPLSVSGRERQKYLARCKSRLCATCALDGWLERKTDLTFDQKNDIRGEKLRALYRT